MLKLKNVSLTIDSITILEKINLTVNGGEVHAIIGPKASGKSTLAHMIQGSPCLEPTEGTITFKNKNINKVPAYQRSQRGIFVSFQHPIEIEGLTNYNLTKSMFESRTDNSFSNEVEIAYKTLIKTIGLDKNFKDDTVNSYGRNTEDFKKSEIVQMLMIQPDLVILDEIEAELEDEESFEYIMLMIKNYVLTHNTGLVIISNNRNILDKFNPSHVHVLADSKLTTFEDGNIYKRILEDGYTQFS